MSLLQYIADLLDVKVNQITFVTVQIISIPIALFFRQKLSPKYTSCATRHTFGGVIGMLLLYWCFGWSVLHMVAQAVGVYLILMYLPAKYNYKLAFLFAMGYMLYVQIIRYLTVQDRDTFEISFPMMMSTQKLTSLAFSIQDGRNSDKESMRSFQKRYAISKCPSLIEIFGFVFFFGGVVSGPSFFYRDYAEFITGENYICKQHISLNGNGCNGETKNGISSEKYNVPDPTREVVKKLGLAFLNLFLFLIVGSIFPVARNIDDDFINTHGFIYRLYYFNVSVWLCQFKYYFVWLISETIQNASGLGLHYVNGNPQWDLTTNVYIPKIMFPIAAKDVADNWNITTAKWLRHASYERTGKYKVVLTFLLSAVWHGVEPGFYFTFLTVALVVIASRKVRKAVRHRVVGTRWKPWYDVLTGFSAVVGLIYCLGGFHMLTLTKTLQFYTYSMYWWLHIVLVIAILTPFPQESRTKCE